MKKLYFLLFALMISSLSFGQTTLAAQDFEGAGTWSYTATPTAYNVGGGDVWDIVGSIGSISSAQTGSNFWGIRDIENPTAGEGGSAVEHTLEFPNVNVSGQTDMVTSFYYYSDGFDSSDYLKVEFFFDDVSQGQEDLAKSTGAWTLFSKVVPNGTTNVKFTLIARQNGSTDYAGFDNILLQSGVNTDPTLSITSPTDSETVNSGFAGFDVTLDIQNFTVSGDAGGGVSDNSGDGFIKYSVDSGSDTNKFDNGAITITGLSSGAHTIDVELVDNSGSSLSPAVTASVNITINNTVQNLPLYDAFDYTDGESLGDQPLWSNNFSGDDVLISAGSLTYPNLSASQGNKITFAGSGADPSIDFTPVNSNKVYASFVLNIPDATTLSSDEYFAILRNEDGNYLSRVWIRNDGSDNLEIGIGQSSGATFSTGSYTAGTPILIVFAYEFVAGASNDIISVWVNPAFGPEPTATASQTAGTEATAIRQLIIRQDSGMPTTEIDELRVGTSWADVTPNTLSTGSTAIEGFNLYPNPTSGSFVNISSNSNEAMNVNVFDILGKKVISTVITNNRLDVGTLNTGVYIMRVTQNNAIATRKLIIK